MIVWHGIKIIVGQLVLILQTGVQTLTPRLLYTASCEGRLIHLIALIILVDLLQNETQFACSSHTHVGFEGFMMDSATFSK